VKLRIREISAYPLVPLEEVVEIQDYRRKPISGAERAGMRGDIPYYGANGLLDHIKEHIFDEELVLVAEDGGFFDDPHKPISYRVSGKCWVNNHAHVLRPLANVDIDWLNYSIAQQDVSDVVNGAVLPKLTQRDLRRLPIPLPKLPEQRRLVKRIKECLSRVEEMQRLRAEMEAEAAALVVAAVREHFDPLVQTGNLRPFGELVATTRLGLVRSKSEQGADRAFAYFKMNNVARRGRVDLSTMTRVDASPQEARDSALAEGDFLFNTRNSYELVGKTAVVPAFRELLLFNNNLLRVRFRDDVLSSYVNYAFQHPFVQRELDLRKSKTTNVCAVYYKSLQSLPIPFPKRKADQQAITGFLQRVERAATAMESQLEEQELDYPDLRESILREAFAGNL
jgi:type I restriction enzyme S subunit